MRKELSIIVFVCLSFSLFAEDNDWHLGYSENSGIALLNDNSNINSVLQSSSLPVVPNSEVFSSVRSLFLSTGKWIFTFGNTSLNSSENNTMNGYDSGYTARGWLFQCGYNMLAKEKSELYLSIGGGQLNSIGTIFSNEKTDISAIDDLFLYGCERVEFVQNYTSVSVGLSYLYPLFNNILNCADLKLGANCNYWYNFGTSAKLNDKSFIVDNNTMSGFSFGVSLMLSFDLTQIINE
jgi:hypothetical protein